MIDPDTPSIAGGWLGTYHYPQWAGQPPVRFEATFILRGTEGRFTGTILDDDVLGEASVLGTQKGLRVNFSKVYQHPPPGHGTGKVFYEGGLSEDGRFLKGTWKLRGLSGGWEAHRLWGTEEAPEAQPEEEPAAAAMRLAGAA